MAELSPAQTEVYVPRSLQLWRGLMNWLDFFFRLLVQILKNTPLVSQILTCLGLKYAPSSHSYKSLPHVELPLHHPPLKADDLANDSGSGDHHTDKLTPPPSTAEELVSNNGSGDHFTDKLTVILPLLKHLSLQNDVRPVLYEKFHMPEWFQMHGIPASGLKV